MLRNRRKSQQELWQTQELMPGPGVFCFPAVPCLPSPCCLFLCSPPAISLLSPPGSPELLCWSPCFPASHHLLCISSSLSPSLVCLILFNLYFPWKQTPFLWDPAPHEQSPRQEHTRTLEHACQLSASTLASSSSSSSPTAHRGHSQPAAQAAQHSPSGQCCSFHPGRSVIMGLCLTPPTQLPETQWILIPQDTPDTCTSSFGQGNQLGEACLLPPRRMPPVTCFPPSGPPAQAPAARPRLQHGKARLRQP